MQNNVILDCDTGEDDALAILIALANHLPLKLLVTSYGNTSLENATRNSSQLLSLAEAKDVLVLPGSIQPLMPHLIEKEVSAGSFVGKNGLCNTQLSPSKFDNILSSTPESFVAILSEYVRRHGKIDYIITGPCTNFAKLCTALGDDIHYYINQVFIMGGALYAPGNSGPKDSVTNQQVAEFNFYCDPLAAGKVLNSGLPIKLVSWDVTSTVTLSFAEIQHFQSQSASGQFAITLMQNFFKYYGLGHDRNFELNDPLTVLACLGWGNYREEKVKVVTEKMNYGQSNICANGALISYFNLTDKGREQATQKMLTDLKIGKKRAR